MTRRARAERTQRILTARLEELACALERPGAPRDTARLVESAAVATANAVALELLSADAAQSIWREVERRHPAVAALAHAA